MDQNKQEIKMEFTEQQLDELAYSEEYAEYIMENCHGDHVIGNGDSLLMAMESQYLFDEFIESIS